MDHIGMFLHEAIIEEEFVKNNNVNLIHLMSVQLRKPNQLRDND